MCGVRHVLRVEAADAHAAAGVGDLNCWRGRIRPIAGPFLGVFQFAQADVVGVGVQDVERVVPAEALHTPRAALALLQHVGQFMRNEVAAGVVVGLVLAGAEVHVAAQRVGAGVQRLRRTRSAGAGVHAHVAEVRPHARLEKTAQAGGQCSAAAAGSCRSGGGSSGRQTRAAHAAGAGLGLDACLCAAAHAARRGAGHDAVRDTFGFLFLRVGCGRPCRLPCRLRAAGRRGGVALALHRISRGC